MAPRIYTRTGDDGTSGLYFGGRAPKTDAVFAALGAVDEAQAAIGLARAEAEPGGELDRLLTGICRDLYVCMSELGTAAENHAKLVDGQTRATPEMVAALEPLIDDLLTRVDMPSDFVIPGANRVAAALDLARAVVRRGERESLAVAATNSS